jgi:hypothetical protein
MATLISAGTLATAPGGHGTQYGLPIPTLTKPDEAQGFVDARIAEGSDFIKIIYDDWSTFSLSRPTLSLEIIAALIEAAHKKGKIVVVHAATLKNCQDVLIAGADGLAHMYFNEAFDPEFGRQVAKEKAFVIPTLSVLERMKGARPAGDLMGDPRIGPYLKPGDIRNLKQSFPVKVRGNPYPAIERAVRQLRDEEVPILAGTDVPNAGIVFGASLHRELLLLVEAGLSPLDALRAATSVPAEIFRIAGRGRIEAGWAADLVLVNGDPTQDIKAMRDIVAVWKDGQLIDRKGYQDSVTEEKEKVEEMKKMPPPPNSESGWISDCEGDGITTNFGAGWSVSTDAVMGGKSKADFGLAEGGAGGSRGSMRISGTVVEGSSINWAGVLFSPGEQPMTAANLSSKKSLAFRAKGEGRSYTVMIYSQSLGFIPAIRNFDAGPEWKEYDFPFEEFGLEGHDITGIFIGASMTPGEFVLSIDDVRLK